ncbi:hypothetical protein NAC44_18085 [Allorhizobium sp. BGMRC 0089]|uniref:hypothetical protein n=1 Tax=Allorhizobium sonneratiae TaxID=2934936 RepID=UPI00203497F0|nr:hypothetical protein [Allorhizobium sonneratiae]MCM2294240.1 hypothetical protein [Allorhizobium sonneratiae]
MTSPTRTTAPTRAMPLGRQIGRNGLIGAASIARDMIGEGRPGTVRNISMRASL